ncbi:hypothetical protein JCM17960_06750 [Magnetospira thiophila]
MDIAAAAAQAMGESCQSAGLVAHSLLLTPALMLVLDDPDLERDWLAGKDVFAAVRLRDLAPALWDYGASAP